MSVIYQSQFTRAGSLARDGFADGMFITFAENEATDDMTDYCFLHTHGRLAQDFAPGDLCATHGTHP